MINRKIVLTGLTSLLLIAGCSSLSKGDSVISSGDSKDITRLENTDDIYGVSTLTSVSLLSQYEENTGSATLAWNDVSDEEVEKINTYISMFETLLADDGIISSKIEESDVEDYDYLMTIKVKNFLNETTTYLMYFNEVVIETDDELITDTDLDTVGDISETADTFIDRVDNKLKEVRNLDRFKDKIDEMSTKLEGIMIVGEDTYDIVGLKVVNGNTVRTRFISMKDKRDYVVVTNMTNDDKNTFNYRVVKDGKFVSRSMVEFKEVDSKTEIKLRLLEGRDYKEYLFTKISEENKQIIRIRIIEDMNVTDIKVFIETNEETGEVIYRYRFFDGREFIKQGKDRIKKVIDDLKDIKEKIKEKLKDRIPEYRR